MAIFARSSSIQEAFNEDPLLLIANDFTPWLVIDEDNVERNALTSLSMSSSSSFAGSNCADETETENDSDHMCEEESGVSNKDLTSAETGNENEQTDMIHVVDANSGIDCIETSPLTVDKSQDVRPKEFASYPVKPIKKCLSEIEYVCNDSRKKKTKKVRERKLRQWKLIDAEEFGFHVSLLPIPSLNSEDCGGEAGVTENVNNADSHADEVADNYGGSLASVETESACDVRSDQESTECLHVSGHSDAKVVNTNDDDDDDVTFFKNLGIDITDGDDGDDFDEFTVWDGVHVEKHSLSKSSQQIASINMTIRKRDKNGSGPKSSTKSCTQKDTTHTVKPCAKKCDIISSDNQTFVKFLKKYDIHKLYELECSSQTKIYARRDKDKRTRKVHKEIKSKHCAPTLYNPSKKKLYIHHRLYKKLGGDSHDFWSSRTGLPRMPRNGVDLGVARAIRTRNARDPSSRSSAPTQNLKHALHETNRPTSLEGDLASFLISLQHRELTPEDYEMLLRLDDSIKAKTVSNKFLNRLKTDTVNADQAGQECSVCMDQYIEGQKMKFLPCGHGFHEDCIDNWLKNCSTNCPLDGLPVDAS